MSGIPVKNKFKSKFTGCKCIQPLRSVLGGSTFCSNDCCECFGGKSPPALDSEMVKSLPIPHVKIALVLPSLMGIVDRLQSSCLVVNVQLGSSQDLDWITEEHLFSSYSATSVWLYLCASDHCPVEM